MCRVGSLSPGGVNLWEKKWNKEDVEIAFDTAAGKRRKYGKRPP